MNAERARVLVFGGQPYCTISRFSQYRTHLSQLPDTEQRKVDQAAEWVIKSYLTPVVTGGIVEAIGIRGHADQDLLKSGQARLDFEQKVSEERAQEVLEALIQKIKIQSFRLGVAPMPAGDPFYPIVEGMGARMLIYRQPKSEYERSLNRRVEVYFLRHEIPPSRLAAFDVPPQKKKTS